MIFHRDLRLLSYFVEVANAGTISGAAKTLSVSPAVVSEAISTLESNLSVTLLERSTRKMRLTDSGEEVLQHAVSMVVSAEQAMLVASQRASQVTGKIRVTAPAELCLAKLSQGMRPFIDKYPSIHLEVDADDRLVQLKGSDFDLAVRATYIEQPTRRANEDDRYEALELVCAPQLLSRSDKSIQESLSIIGFVGPPNKPGNTRLLKAHSSGHSASDQLSLELPCRYAVNNHVVAHQLAVQGLGVALLMRATVKADLEAGLLTQAAPGWDFGYLDVSVRYRDNYPSAAARAFKDHFFPSSI